MKKLLILAYDFPPYVSVGGLRPYSWYRYLKEYDICPVVVTRQWGNKYGNELDYIVPSQFDKTIIEETEFGTIIKTPYKPNLSNRLLIKYGKSKFKLLRKAITAYYEIMQFFLPIGTKVGLYIGAEEYLKKNKVDVVIATGEPFILFKYANKLSRKYNVPWIADYRDPWTFNQNKSSNFLIKYWNSFFEKKYVKNSNIVTTVSNFFVKKINKVVKNKEVIILPNGYNPDLLDNITEIAQDNEVLSFAFVGSIMIWDPYERVLSCFNQFLKDNPDNRITLDFYGVNKDSKIKNLLDNKFQILKSCVTIYPNTPNGELLKRLSTYNLMLLFNYYDFPGTKVYDYLAIKRRILLCYSNDSDAIVLKDKYYSQDETEGLSTHVQEDIIRETKSGIVAKDYNHLYEILGNLYAEFQEKGKIQCDSVNIQQFSRKNQTKKLAEVIKSINS